MAPKKDNLQVEMRKRVFWTLYTLSSNLSGKLGRPMPINLADVDVEFPEPIDDCVAGEPLTTPFYRCSFQVGIQIAKFAPISSKLFSTIYAVRQSPHSYEQTVREIEKEVQTWKEQLPKELAEGHRANAETKIFALYLEFWEQECQLLLHHPALCHSTNTELYESNLDKCLEAASKMAHNCTELRHYRSLDVPWINSVVYIAAIFTTLFIYFQRRDRLSGTDMSKLRNEMGLWIEIMLACGQVLGKPHHSLFEPKTNSDRYW